MKKKFIKTPLIGVLVHDVKDVGTRTVNLLMGEHAGEYVRGDIMDANAVIQAFDELKGDVDTDHDTLEELVNEIHENTEGINNANTLIQKVDAESKARDENETSARSSKDAELENSIAEERTRALNKEKEISDKLAIVDGDSNTEGSFRKAIADVIAVDTSDFVSKTTTDNQSIKSRLKVSGELSVSNNTNSSNISLYAHDGAPALSIYAMSSNQYNASLTTRELRMSSTLNNLVITCDGISSKDDNADHVYATDGSIADLTQYVLKSIYDEKIAALESRIAALEANHQLPPV